VTQLKKEIKDAVNQIQRTGLRGVIALNLEKRLDGLPASADDDEVLQYVDALYDADPELAKYYEWHPGIFGIITVSAIERILPEPAPNGLPQFDVSRPLRFRRYHESETLLARVAAVAFYAPVAGEPSQASSLLCK